MRYIITVVLLVFAVLMLQKTSKVRKIKRQIDSLERQTEAMFKIYNVDTYDSLTPLFEKNFELREKLIREGEAL